jgi:DNA-directed RNA polymerase specialized sigma24 family protein
MNIRELQRSYENRIKEMGGFIFKQTRKNEDLRQEACLAMWRGLLKDPLATDAFLMNRIRWRMINVWESSSSVDKPHKKRDDITILRFYPQDFENEIYAEYLSGNGLPLDEQVIAKVDSERFLQSLDHNERGIVKYKIKGESDKATIKKLHISSKRYYRIKSGLKPKIKEFFAV